MKQRIKARKQVNEKLRIALLAIFVIFAVLVSATPLQAQENSKSTSEVADTILFHDEIVISAQRYDNRAFDRPEVISTLNQAALTLLSPMSTPDALAYIPGVWMQKTNHGGGSPFIRGLTGYQTLILIDGVRFNNATFRSGPNQYLNTIDPYTLSRVEVMKGQGSVQYGSDAIGGVINLMTYTPRFTEEGKAINSRLSAKGMSGGMEYSGRASLDVVGSKYAISGGATYKKLGDIRAGGQLGKLSPTGYQENAFDFKSLFKLGNSQLLTVGGQSLRQAKVPLYHKVISGEYQTYLFDPQERSLAYAKWESSSTSKIFKRINIIFSYQHSLEKRIKRKTGSNLLTEETDKVNTTGVTLEWIAQPTDFWRISSGVEGYFDRIGSNTMESDIQTNEQEFKRGLYPDQSKAANMAAFSLHSFQLKRLHISTGARLNSVRLSIQDDLFGLTHIKPLALVGNLGLVYKLTKNLRITSSINSAFRAPNINDVSSFGVADFRYEVPNYDLKPEKSLNLELGVKFKNDRSAFGIAVYRNRLKNLIANVVGSYNGKDSIDGVRVYRRENINEAVIRGFELEWFQKLPQRLHTFGFVSYTFGQNISKDEPMRRIPPLNGRVGLQYRWQQNWQLRADWIFAAAQNRLSGGDMADDRIAEDGTPSWNVVNLLVVYQQKTFLIDFGFQNIFNEAYRVHGSGIDGLGRSLWMAIKVSINRD